MAKNKLSFKNAEMARNAITASQKREISKLYEDWADEIGERAKFYSRKSTASAPISERYYKELQKQLRATSQEISNEIYGKIKRNMHIVSDAVVADNIKWLKSFGFIEDGLNAAFSYVPDEVVRRIITGQVYDSGWSLSSRIWSDNEKTLKDIYQVMAKGLAENKPIYDIAKDLETYVRPSAKLPWNTKGADGVKIFKKQVDYNAQRLARTLVQHSYQQSFIATTQDNPFVTEYLWISNGSRVCDLCRSRDGMHFKKDELPMDHPNGMCTMRPVVADNMVDQIADWYNSPDGTYPEIDKFAKNFGYDVTPAILNGKNSIFGINLNVPQLDSFSKEVQDVLPQWADDIENSTLPNFTELSKFLSVARTDADQELLQFMFNLNSNVQSYKGISDDKKKIYANIFSVVSKPHKTALYRGESGIGVERFGEFKEGKVITFDSFGFTSPSKDTPSFHTGVLFEFMSGTPSINFPGQDLIDDDELILGNFEIINVKKTKNGVPHVILKYIK